MPDAATRPRPTLVVAVLASCGLGVSLTQTIVVPLLPAFPALLGASASTVSWLVTATLVSGAVLAPVLGRLADMYGRPRMLLVALGAVTVGSAVGAVAPGVEVLLVGRVLQGAALGVVPLGITVLRDVLPVDRVGSGVALMSSSLGVGGAVGLPLTGFVAEHAGWRWLFVGSAVVGAAQFLLVRWLVRVPAAPTGGRFDLLGAAGFGAALLCLLLAVSRGAEWGWTSAAVLGLGTAALALFIGWGRHERRHPEPLVDLRVNARPAVLWTNVASVLVGFAMFAAFLVTTQILQAPVATGYGFGLSLAAAGLALLPIGGAMSVFSPVSARLSHRFGARATLVLGAVVMAVGNLAMATLPGSLAAVMGTAGVIAVGAAIAYSALPLLVMAAVPPGQTAAANSLNTLMRMLGTSSCSAVVAAATTGLTMRTGGVVLPAAGAYALVFGAAGALSVGAAVIAALTPHPVADTVPEPVAAAV